MTEVQKKPCPPLVGADIECFLADEETYEPIPCVGLVPGTKECPLPMEGLPKGYALQEDNVMLEFNIPPAKTYTAFTASVSKARSYMYDYINKKRPNTEILFQTDMLFKAKDLTSPQAQLIGCEPDLDAYHGGAVRTIRDNKLGRWRSAGGHIHLGGDFQCPDFVAALFCDVALGLACDLSGIMDNRRAEWYGQPGVFRSKPYGIEYRTPSCTWAGSRKQTQNVGARALGLSKWLTETDARDIQRVFRKIDWAEVRSAMMIDTTMTTNQRRTRRNNILHKARMEGFPV